MNKTENNHEIFIKLLHDTVINLSMRVMVYKTNF